MCLCFLFARWNYSLIFKKISFWRGNPRLPPYRLIISDFPAYLENNMIYLKIKNNTLSGILLSRWHDSLILKTYPVLRKTRTYVRTYRPTDHCRFHGEREVKGERAEGYGGLGKGEKKAIDRCQTNVFSDNVSTGLLVNNKWKMILVCY